MKRQLCKAAMMLAALCLPVMSWGWEAEETAGTIRWTFYSPSMDCGYLNIEGSITNGSVPAGNSETKKPYAAFDKIWEFSSEFIPGTQTTSSYTVRKGKFVNVSQFGDYAATDLTIVDCTADEKTIFAIGAYSFANFIYLRRVNIETEAVDQLISAKLRFIETGAFYGCSSLQEFNFDVQAGGVAVESIGAYAFYGCRYLENFDFPSQLTALLPYTFAYSGLREITIPNKVVVIHPNAFRGCSQATAFHVGKSLNYLSPQTFYAGEYVNANDQITLATITADEANTTYKAEGNCLIEQATNKLVLGASSSTIPVYVTAIGDYAFGANHALTQIEIPAAVASIGAYAFDHCENLAAVYCQSDIPPTIDSTTFTNIAPEAVLYVPAMAIEGYREAGWGEYFAEIKGYQPVGNISWDIFNRGSESRPKWILSITGSGPMEDYTDPDEVPWSLTKLGETDFNKINQIIVGEGITHIGDYAFAERNSSKSSVSVTLPSTVTSIGQQAFAHNLDLQSLKLPAALEYIGDDVFAGSTELTSITMPASDQSRFYAKDSCLIDRRTQTLRYGCKTSVIPEGVKAIGDGAFREQSTITQITIPDSVASIGDMAFYGCQSLETVTLGRSVESIGDDAFGGCTQLATVTSLPYTKPYSHTTGIFPTNVPKLMVYNTDNYAEWSSYFSSIEGIPVEFVDGTTDSYEDILNEEEGVVSRLIYRRTLLANNYWNALYVPFEIDMADIAGKYDVAYINDVRAYDMDEDGTIDQMEVEVIKLSEGTLHANHPYLIRVRKDVGDEARNMALELKTTLRHKATEVYDCSSMYMTYEFAGTYGKLVKGEDEELDGAYAISVDGAWQPIQDGSGLNPFRIYMKMTPRPGSPIKVSPEAAAKVRIYTRGEETTDVQLFEAAPQSEAVYDLQGRRVAQPQQGLYIVNGKKTIIK